MTEGSRPLVLTDAQWEVLAPLVEACRPPHKTEHHDLRRTIEAIIWRHDSGAKWRQIPAALGPWWMAAQTTVLYGSARGRTHPYPVLGSCDANGVRASQLQHA